MHKLLVSIVFILHLAYGYPRAEDGRSKGRQKRASDDNLPRWPAPSSSTLGNYSSAAVVADSGVCSDIGKDILSRGGNAVDAAVAATFCIGVADPNSAGIGGGHFMTIYNKTSKSCYIIDARETAPSSAFENMFANDTSNGDRSRGWRSISIPGEVYGLRKAYEIGGSGKVPWGDLLKPTVDLCRNGIPISPALGDALKKKKDEILNEPTMKDLFFDKQNNRMYQKGDKMKRPVLADTLEQLAKSPDPIRTFYNGPLTDKFMSDFGKQKEAIVTRKDFANYTARMGPKERPAIKGNLGGNTVACGPPPPSSAAVAIAILNIMSQLNITPQSIGRSVSQDVEIYHKFLEAVKYSYSVRTRLADIDFFPGALDLARKVVSDEFTKQVLSRITDKAGTSESSYQILKELDGQYTEDHGTTHISVLDAEGNAVSITTTVNMMFGAMRRSVSTDIIWNDDLDNFAIPQVSNDVNYAPKPYNDIAPHKRHLSAMSPLVLYDEQTGEVQVVAGGGGGLRIISAVADVVSRILWFGQNVKEATDAPRLHNPLHPLSSDYEAGFPKVYIDKLNEKGQNLTAAKEAATTCAVARSNGRILANSDYRKGGGYPAGY